jgi:hypothetical protein
MRRNWLTSSKGESFVAMGTYAIMFSLAMFTLLDFWSLLTGRLVSLHRPMGLWCLFWAAVAGLFSAVLLCTGKPLVPRIVAGLFSVSMASQVIEQFVALPSRQLKLLAFSRILVALVLVLMVVIGLSKGKKSLLEWLRTRH